MAKYQAYAEYKYSGIEWLGEIPSHWKIASLRFLVEAVSNGSTASQVEESETTVPISRIESISTGEIDMNKVGFVDIKTISQNFKLHKNDILLSHINSLPMVGNIALKRDDSTLFHGMNLLRLVPNRTITAPYYLFWLLKSIYFRKSVESVAKPAINQASVSIDSLKNIKLLVPNIDEQLAIANFLDHETTKIDHLIEKQQQLIELLKEKRQAVISHAVTKGLNPNVPMKDSGVAWLGEVPEHWKVTRFKFLCDSIVAGPFGSSITKDMYVNQGFKVYGQEQVIPNNFEIGDYYISEKNYKELARYAVDPGDILISCVGTFGKIAVFPSNGEKGIINPRLIKATLSKDHNSYFYREFLKSEAVFKQFEQLSRGGTMGVINIAILNEIVAVAPDTNEQEAIYVFIAEQKIKFSHLIGRACEQIELLKERRTALISAAVTGKIDVRNWQAPSVTEADTELSA